MSESDRKPMRLYDWRREHRPGSPHKALWDEEITTFVDTALQAKGFCQIAKEGRERFGARMPSKSAIHRYWRTFFGGERSKR